MSLSRLFPSLALRARRGYHVSCLSFLFCISLGCQKAPPAPEEEHPAPVKVAEAKTTPLGEWTELLGGAQPLPNHSARVTAAVEGQILWVLGDGKGKSSAEGQHVEKGQVIVQLDDRIAKHARDKALAQFRDLKELIVQAGIAKKTAEVDVKRFEELTSTSGTTLTSPLASKIDLQKARLTLQDAESKERAAMNKQQIAKADLEHAEIQWEFHQLRAPIAGRLGIVQALPGQTLAIGMAVAEVVDLDKIDVVCFVAPKTVTQLALDQPARLASPEAAQRGPPGKVVFIAVQGESASGNFLVKVRFPNPDLRLRANMACRVQVLTKPEKNRLTIPEVALLEDQDPPAVVLVTDVKTEKDDKGHAEKKGKARKLTAIVGVRDRDKHLVEILGLEDPAKKKKVELEHALFVVEGGHGLHDDDPVKIEEEHEEHKEEK